MSASAYSDDTGATRQLKLEPLGLVLPPRLDRPLFSAHGSLLWAVNEREDIELMVDVTSGEVIGQFDLGLGHPLGVWSLDSSVLVRATFGTTVQIFRP